MQGTVLTPIKCSVQIDTLERDVIAEDSDKLYKYNGYVRIPPLALTDDILTVTKCGLLTGTVLVNNLFHKLKIVPKDC